jgi:hypothetical protein
MDQGQPSRDGALVWHYTNAAGLHGIIQSNAVRATSAAFMNDAHEMKSGRDAFAALFKARELELDSAAQDRIRDSGIMSSASPFSNYLLSASTDPDSLTLWRNYGGSEVAYSIGLERAATLSPLAQSPADIHPNPPRSYFEPDWEELGNGDRHNNNQNPDYELVLGGPWTDVSYISGPNDPQIVRRFESLIAEEKGKGGIRGFPAYALSNSPTDFMKHVGFADEKEVRSVTWVNPEWKFVLHRPSRFGLIPYIELTGAEGKEDFAPRRNSLPIRQITIGPNPLSEDAKRSLRVFLDMNGYGEVEIFVSETPFR